jgi:ABC-type transporter Mla maintaining outer membrane lipid asymmetry permease subunit MlaE
MLSKMLQTQFHPQRSTGTSTDSLKKETQDVTKHLAQMKLAKTSTFRNTPITNRMHGAALMVAMAIPISNVMVLPTTEELTINHIMELKRISLHLANGQLSAISTMPHLQRGVMHIRMGAQTSSAKTAGSEMSILFIGNSACASQKQGLLQDSAQKKVDSVRKLRVLLFMDSRSMMARRPHSTR